MGKAGKAIHVSHGLLRVKVELPGCEHFERVTGFLKSQVDVVRIFAAPLHPLRSCCNTIGIILGNKEIMEKKMETTGIIGVILRLHLTLEQRVSDASYAGRQNPMNTSV